MLEMCTVKYPLEKIITDTHRNIMAIPAHRACGRNIMGEGISSGLFRFLFLRPLTCIFRGFLLFLLIFARLIYLSLISTIISAFISSLLLLRI